MNRHFQAERFSTAANREPTCGERHLVSGLLVAMVLLLATCPLAAMTRWSALSMIESGDNDRALGTATEVSRYQIKLTLWNRLAPEGSPLNRDDALAVAQAIMRVRCAAFERQYRRPPTDFEFYVLWNAPAQLLTSGQHAACTEAVAERARRFCNLIQVPDSNQAVRPASASAAKTQPAGDALSNLWPDYPPGHFQHALNFPGFLQGVFLILCSPCRRRFQPVQIGQLRG
jgi:hypothetical protein